MCKLVRDKIPEVIMATGKVPDTKILVNDSEYLTALDNKLYEEIEEYMSSRNLEELADILEVVFAHCELLGGTKEELFEICAAKRLSRGSFKQRIFWNGNK